MKRIAILTGTIVVGWLAFTGSAQAATSCGNITDSSGQIRQIAVYYVPCKTAKAVGAEWRKFLIKVEEDEADLRNGGANILGWKCLVGNTVEGYCGNQKHMIWILWQVGEPVGHLRPHPKPIRSKKLTVRLCGELPEFGAYHYIKTRGIKCRTGQRIALRVRSKFCSRHNSCSYAPYPADLSKSFRGQIKRNGWKCSVVVGYEFYRVICKKGKKKIRSEGGA